MAITDIFTGAPIKEAAAQSRGLFQGAQDNIFNMANLTRAGTEGFLKSGYGGARDDLSQGYGAAQGSLGQGFTGARGDLGQGYNAATGAINTGATGALGYLDQGATGALGQLGQARSDLTANGGAYAPLTALAGRYGQGAGLYADALGINGPEGNTRAVGAFEAGPGYNFLVDQSIDALNRRRNAAGSLVGGNADADAIRLGQGLAKQEYGSWLDRLGGFNQLELGATQGAAAGNAGINQNLANLGVTGANILNQQGQNKASVATGQGGSLADIANRYFGGQANLDTSEGGAMADLASRYFGGQAGLDTAEGTALAGNLNDNTRMLVSSQLNLTPQVAKTYQDEAAAEMQGQKNLWNLGMQAATAAAGGFGGMPGGFPASADPFRMGFASPSVRA